MLNRNYFRGLGVGTELGRGFLQEDEDDHTPVTVISERYWSTHYARSGDVIGKTLYIKSVPFTIIGVAIKGFDGTEGKLPLDFWTPLQSKPEFNAWGSPAEDGMYLTKQHFWCIKLMVRTAPGVNREQALARTQAVFDQAAYTGVRPKRGGDETYQVSFTDAKQFDSQDDSFARALKTLMAMVCLVLLIAMSNVVMLLMARMQANSGSPACGLRSAQAQGRWFGSSLRRARCLSLWAYRGVGVRSGRHACSWIVATH